MTQGDWGQLLLCQPMAGREKEWLPYLWVFLFPHLAWTADYGSRKPLTQPTLCTLLLCLLVGRGEGDLAERGHAKSVGCASPRDHCGYRLCGVNCLLSHLEVGNRTSEFFLSTSFYRPGKFVLLTEYVPGDTGSTKWGYIENWQPYWREIGKLCCCWFLIVR